MPKTIAFGSLTAAALQLMLTAHFYSEFLVMLRKGGSSIGPVGALNVALFFGLSGLALTAAGWCFLRSSAVGIVSRAALFLAAASLVAGCVLFAGLLLSGAMNV